MALLDAHAMLLRGITLFGEVNTDTELLTNYNTPFLEGANAGCADLWERKGIRYCDDITLDANKQFLVSALTYSPKVIEKISIYQDNTAAAGFTKATPYDWELLNGTSIIVPDATASTVVYVYFKPFPPLLVNPYPVAIVSPAHAAGEGATSPLFISEYEQRALIYKGMAEIRSSQNDPDMAKWETKYFQIADTIRKLAPQKKIKNLNQY